MPSLSGDSIAFVPVPRTDFSSAPAPDAWVPAMRRGRVVATELTARWTERWPNAIAAWMHRSFALELSGILRAESPVLSASQALDRANALDPTPIDRARIQLAATRIALRVGDIANAHRIAYGALREHTTSDSAMRALLLPAAALVGDLALALKLSLPRVGSDPAISSSLADSLAAFSVRAQLGECTGLAESLTRINSEIDARFTPRERSAQRRALLQAAFRDAVPCLGPHVTTEFESAAPIDRAYRALAQGMPDSAARVLANVRRSRRGATVGSITWDVTYAEAWLCTQAGDTAAAVAQLRSALNDIQSLSSFTLDQPGQAAGLRRGLLLFRTLAWDRSKVRDPRDSVWAERTLVLQ